MLKKNIEYHQQFTRKKLNLNYHQLFFLIQTITGNYNMAKQFNYHFSNIGSSLANNIQGTQLSFNTYMPEPVTFSFYVTPTTLTEIKSVISNS